MAGRRAAEEMSLPPVHAARGSNENLWNYDDYCRIRRHPLRRIHLPDS
jgi:hypothetical protein